MDMNRLFGGNPLGVLLRLVLLSVIVGVVMSAFNIRPQNIVWHLRLLLDRISALGFGIFEGALGYFALGAVIVIPVWLIIRLLSAFGGNGANKS